MFMKTHFNLSSVVLFLVLGTAPLSIAQSSSSVAQQRAATAIGSKNKLTPAQVKAAVQALAKAYGNSGDVEALVAAVSALSKANPTQAAAIASAATAFAPALSAQIAASAASAAPAQAAAVAAAVATAVPASAPQIAASVSAAVPAAAVAIAQSVSSAVPAAATAISAAVVAAVPSADAAAVAAAAQNGAQTPASTNNQPLITGDQGTITDGQSLPGSTGSGTGGSGAPPRPTPTPIPTPVPAS